MELSATLGSRFQVAEYYGHFANDTCSSNCFISSTTTSWNLVSPASLPGSSNFFIVV